LSRPMSITARAKHLAAPRSQPGSLREISQTGRRYRQKAPSTLSRDQIGLAFQFDLRRHRLTVACDRIPTCQCTPGNCKRRARDEDSGVQSAGQTVFDEQGELVCELPSRRCRCIFGMIRPAKISCRVFDVFPTCGGTALHSHSQ